MMDRLLVEHRDQIIAHAKQHGVTDLRVFGSMARGDAKPDSDVDFLVEFENGRSLLDQSALILDLEDLLGRKVDVVTRRSVFRGLLERIRSEAVRL
jgi:hypothetical protein